MVQLIAPGAWVQGHMTGRGLGFGHINPASGHGKGTLTLALQETELPVEVAGDWRQTSPKDVPGDPQTSVQLAWLFGAAYAKYDDWLNYAIIQHHSNELPPKNSSYDYFALFLLYLIAQPLLEKERDSSIEGLN